MMRKSFSLFYLILGAVSFEFKSFNITGLINFMETLCGQGHTSQTLQEHIAASAHVKAELVDLTKRFSRLSLDHSIEGAAQAEGRPVNFTTKDLIMMASVKAA